METTQLIEYMGNLKENCIYEITLTNVRLDGDIHYIITANQHLPEKEIKHRLCTKEHKNIFDKLLEKAKRYKNDK